jgi:DNA-binding NtrC family response regulator
MMKLPTKITVALRKPPEANEAPKTLPQILEAYERIVIIQALVLNGHSRTKAADSLGIRRRYLYRRMAHLKIDLQAVTMGRSGRNREPDEGESR